MKKILISLIVFSYILLNLSFVLADGGFFSDYYEHMFTPDQKAVITWENGKEVMIIASSTKSEDLSNIAWVVPIWSSTKPEVSESNITIFQDLIDYFVESDYFGKGLINQEAAGGGVEVLEQKEIDVYDITILKATDSQELLGWLNNNGYKVPENTKSILDKYVSRGDMYFVANKIDLKNEFEKEVDILNKISNGQLAEDYYLNGKSFDKLITDIGYYGRVTSYIGNTPVSQFSAADSAKEIYRDASYKSSFFENDVFNDEKFIDNYASKYFFLKKDFLSSFVEENSEFLIEGYRDSSVVTGYDWSVIADSFEEEDSNKPYHSAIDDLSPGIYCRHPNTDNFELIYAGSETKKPVMLWPCQDIPEQKREDIRNNIKEFYDSHSSTKQKFEEDLNELKLVFESGGADMAKVKDMQDKKDKLGQGLSTPLKFEFTPEIPYYPLEISSINQGKTHIEVYVFTTKRISDKNNITIIDKTKDIDLELRKKLSEHIDLGETKYVTRFIYDGELKDLINDAEYVMQNDSWFKLFIEWIKSFF